MDTDIEPTDDYLGYVIALLQKIQDEADHIINTDCDDPDSTSTENLVTRRVIADQNAKSIKALCKKGLEGISGF